MILAVDVHYLEDRTIVAGVAFEDWLDEASQAEWASLTESGVAKKPFSDIAARYELYRGTSSKPLYVTAVGLELEQAKESIRRMHGPHRLPALLKRVDQISRELRAG